MKRCYKLSLFSVLVLFVAIPTMGRAKIAPPANSNSGGNAFQLPPNRPTKPQGYPAPAPSVRPSPRGSPSASPSASPQTSPSPSNSPQASPAPSINQRNTNSNWFASGWRKSLTRWVHNPTHLSIHHTQFQMAMGKPKLPQKNFQNDKEKQWNADNERNFSRGKAL